MVMKKKKFYNTDAWLPTGGSYGWLVSKVRRFWSSALNI